MTSVRQLDLWPEWLARLPWNGRSPRALTRSAMALFLRRKPQKADRFFVDPEQYDMFPAAKTGPPQYGGAPLLVPLDRRVDE